MSAAGEGRALLAQACAKINLGLEVLGRREDGYHEIRTILQTIDLGDDLRFVSRPAGIELEVEGAEVPAGPSNLVWRAAALLAEESGCRRGVSIHVEKRVPPGAGLGGGSSDAALTLLALDRLWGTGASPEDLHRIAARLGMDVPFFLHGGTAIAVGRGDELYPLQLAIDFPIVLILPDFSVSTAEAYRNLRLTKRESSLTLQHFAWGVPGVRSGSGELVNDLEGATGEHSNAIQEFKTLLRAGGAFGSMMSGSGSSVFGMFQDEAAARRATDSLRARGIRAIATRTLGRDEYRAKRFPLPSHSSFQRAEEASER
jgi:4-diphosphocytidyl-2-C-methyl-D-erythritol kinase